MNGPGRRDRRAFILANHPDRGGDPAAFIAGLRRLDNQPPEIDPPPVHVYRSRRTAPARWLRRLRFDGRSRARNLQ